MELKEERKNEIAWKILVHRMRKNGLPHFRQNEFRRDLVNNANEIGVDIDEAIEFSKALILPLVHEMFSFEVLNNGKEPKGDPASFRY